MITVAAAAWPIDAPVTLEAACAKARAWVAQAADGGAQLAVFPEYGAMELAALLQPHIRADLHRTLAALQPLWDPYLETFAEAAQAHGLYVLAPSVPALQGDGAFRNEAWLFGPKGGRGVQIKLHMTRFEAEQWGIAPGRALTLFDCGALGRIGVAICYDAEFPLPVRQLATAGADIVLVPSCTEALAGYTRVNVSSRARAIENQIFTVQASTVGAAPDNPAVDLNCGAGGVYGPADRGFPPTGILAQGALDTPGWTFATLDLEALAAVRCDGQVLNARDWSRFPAAPDLPVATVSVL